MSIPNDRSYTEDHEWVMITPGASLPDAPVRVGITSVAAESLGDLVFVDLPEAGSTITKGEARVDTLARRCPLYPDM